MISFLTDEGVKTYRRLHKNTKVQKKADRIKAILMLNNGYNYEQIAAILLIDDVGDCGTRIFPSYYKVLYGL